MSECLPTLLWFCFDLFLSSGAVMVRGHVVSEISRGFLAHLAQISAFLEGNFALDCVDKRVLNAFHII